MPAGVSAYTALANVTLGSNTSTVTFTSISQSYRDLVLVIEGRSTISENPTMRFNADTGSNYPMVNMYGTGSLARSAGSGSAYFFIGYGVTFESAYRASAIINIMDYSATDKHKSVLIRDDNSVIATEAQAGRWASTAAVNSISCFFNFGANWTTGTTFALYGVSA
jgi:hypothetical protein